MPTININFFNEDLTYTLKNKRAIKNWLKLVIEKEGFNLEELNFIFCSDAYLLKMNVQYLNHDTYTDVITFDNSDVNKLIVGDIFISVDRVKENAKERSISTKNELMRVMVHGLLHLLGYKDKTKSEKLKMTEMEDRSLELFIVQ